MKIRPPPYEEIYSIENLYYAWHKVSLGKSKKNSILDFYRNLDGNLLSIADDLRNKTYKPGHYNRFLIKEPKERIISASQVRDRLVQHAIMNYYAPVFDRHLIFDSYACRVGKGTHKAVLRAFHFAKSSRFFLKMDVRKYFDSIDHTILKKYIRYMDDMLVFYDDKADLKIINETAVMYVSERLKLLLKTPVLASVLEGVPFLGFLFKPSGIFLQNKTKKRYKNRITEIEHKRKRGLFSDFEAGRRIEAVTSHLLLARSRNFRNNLIYGRFFGD